MSISLKQFAFLIALCLSLLSFLIGLQDARVDALFGSFLTSAGVIFLIALVVIALFTFFSRSFTGTHRATYGCLCLSPLLLLLLWETVGTRHTAITPLLVVAAMCGVFWLLLKAQDAHLAIMIRSAPVLSVIVGIYVLFFILAGTRQYLLFSFFNSKDFGVFNQTFWNTIAGNIFANSTYGSHFASHATLFFFFLVPFYALLPHPLTLFIIKNLFLALAVIPFNRAIRPLTDGARIALSLGLLYFPFYASQNLTPPFESCFAPFFLLWTYCFYKEKRFGLFTLFLALSLTIKEHVALIAILFGIASYLTKRPMKWALTSILLGIAWGIVALLVLTHAQKMHHPPTDSIWYLTTLKERFVTGSPAAVAAGLSSSNLGRSFIAIPALSLLLFPVGVIPALLGTASIFGLPELLLNLLYDRPAMLSPYFHYNIIAAAFLLVGTAQGIRRIASRVWFRSHGLTPPMACVLLSTIVLACTLLFMPVWIGMVGGEKDATYAQAAWEALRFVPQDARVSVPHHMAVQVSSRRSYSIIGEGKPGEYAVTDASLPRWLATRDLQGYRIVFRSGEVIVWQKEKGTGYFL